MIQWTDGGHYVKQGLIGDLYMKQKSDYGRYTRLWLVMASIQNMDLVDGHYIGRT